MADVQTQTPSYETVWAILQETAKLSKEAKEEMKKSREEMDKSFQASREEMKRSREEWKKSLKESREEWDKSFQASREEMKKSREEWEKSFNESRDDFNKRFGSMTNRFGEIVEYMIAPNLKEKFKEFGLFFQRSNKDTEFADFNNNIKFEVDIMLENSHKAMLVEIKTKLTTEDVKDHIERLEKMRKYADFHDDKRTFLGAVAGVVTSDNVKDFALSKGFYVIEPSGETFKITVPENNPKEW